MATYAKISSAAKSCANMEIVSKVTEAQSSGGLV
jgi:hypothetical protein